MRSCVGVGSVCDDNGDDRGVGNGGRGCSGGGGERVEDEEGDGESVRVTSGIIHDDDDDSAGPDEGNAAGGVGASAPKQSVHSSSCGCTCGCVSSRQLRR